MKQPTGSTKLRRSRGYATLLLVTTVSLLVATLLTIALRRNLTGMDAEAQAQLKQDYSQKEDAVLTALLHVVPNKAIGAMRTGSADHPGDFTWETIFTEALNLANAEQAVSSDLLTSLGLDEAVSANTGDTVYDSAGKFVFAPSKSPDGGLSLVNGGNSGEHHMLRNSAVRPHIPAPMMVSHSLQLLDRNYPIISFEKKHVSTLYGQDSLYYKGLHVSPDAYPLYNQIAYPDVKFGYRRPGELFVAKRNWWTFSLTFGKEDQVKTGVPPVTKTYVLSIYEIPSQLPLSASALMKVGRFADGTDWENVNLDGGIYADVLETEGDVALGSGSISARESVSLSEGTTVEGRSVDSNFNEPGKREERALESDSDFYDASVGGDVGKVAFIPLNPGTDFLKRSDDGDRSDRISPTGWNNYTRGANQAAMRLEILDVVSMERQIPTRIRFHYRDTDGATSHLTYTRNRNWPDGADDSFPFHTSVLENGRNAIAVYLDRLPAFLTSLGNAADLAANHSILISPDSTQPKVKEPDIPSSHHDLAVTLRGGADMSAYPKGFSIVTDLRLYIAETLNNVPVTPPADSGIPETNDYFPPLSLFTPEKRFGETVEAHKPFALRGQISSLKTNTGTTFNPLDLKGADDERVDPSRMSADLISIHSPAELPPIHLMNWMVTVEEIH
jgi:hypothetical protein